MSFYEKLNLLVLLVKNTHGKKLQEKFNTQKFVKDPIFLKEKWNDPDYGLHNQLKLHNSIE